MQIGTARRSVCGNQYNAEQYNDKIVTKLRCGKTLFVHEKLVCINISRWRNRRAARTHHEVFNVCLNIANETS